MNDIIPSHKSTSTPCSTESTLWFNHEKKTSIIECFLPSNKQTIDHTITLLLKNLIRLVNLFLLDLKYSHDISIQSNVLVNQVVTKSVTVNYKANRAFGNMPISAVGQELNHPKVSTAFIVSRTVNKWCKRELIKQYIVKTLLCNLTR